MNILNFAKICYNSFMLNLTKKSFAILKNNLIFIQPLLLLLLIMLTALSYTVGGKFFEGVGAGFLNVLLSFAGVIIIYTSAFYLLSKILVIYAGVPQFIYKLPQVINTNSQQEVMTFVNGIPEKEKIVFTLWVFSITILTALLNYCSAVYFAVLTFDKKNIFKTFWNAIKFIFKNIPESFFIIVFTEFLYFFLNLLSAFAGVNTFVFIILIILFTMYFNYCLILVFCFYYEKTKVNSTDGAELLGQD